MGQQTDLLSRRTIYGLLTVAALLSGCSLLSPKPAPVPSEPPVTRVIQEDPPALTARVAAARTDLTRMVNLQDQLYRIAAPLLINNADLCRNHARNLLGFTAKNRYSYSGEFIDAAQAVLNYGDQLEVASVLAGSGAARAGLRKGDKLLAAEGKPLPAGQSAETQAAAILAPLVANSQSLNLTVARDGRNQNLNLPVTRACAFRIDIGNADNINAYSDDQRVMITRGMVNFAQSDEAIAYVLATELAHNVLGHAATTRSAYTLGSIMDNLVAIHPDTSVLIGTAGVKPMPQELDAAADYLALYMVARAGYNMDRAHAFWQRLATQYPPTVLNGYTAHHPATAYRLNVIAKTIAEIKAKQASRRPLLP